MPDKIDFAVSSFSSKCFWRRFWVYNIMWLHRAFSYTASLNAFGCQLYLFKPTAVLTGSSQQANGTFANLNSATKMQQRCAYCKDDFRVKHWRLLFIQSIKSETKSCCYTRDQAFWSICVRRGNSVRAEFIFYIGRKRVFHLKSVVWWCY